MAEDAIKYAENLRKSLIDDLFEGDDFQLEGNEAQYSVSDYVGTGELSLLDIDKDLDKYQDHDVIRGILEHGRVLKEYARDIDEKLRQAEMESIQDYIQESDNMVALHDQIRNCDSILSHMEQLLGKFQSELGKVSEEIRQLQVQSQTMSTKLRNRRAAENKLGSFIEHLTVSEHLVNSILENEVDEEYLEYLLALDKKLKFVHDDDIAKTSQAKRDLEPALDKLRIKALTKVREFMLNKIYMLKRPKTNVQIIQQNVLLKYKYFVRFLRQHGQDVYQEIRNEYVGVVSRIQSSHLRTYLSSMEKMQQVLARQQDVIGVSDTNNPAANVLSIFNKSNTKATTEQVFELGDRATILEELNVIIPHVAEHEGKKLFYEVIFRNVHKLLMDTATSEYFFCLDFFEDESVFKEVFAPINGVVEADLAMALQDNWDMISVLLMICITHENRKIMAQRKVPCLDDYLDRVHLLLWPRCKMLFDHQLNSVRSGTERALFLNEPPAPHPVFKRYAALAASMLVLMAQYDADEQGIFKVQTFYDMMDRLWAAMCNMLNKLSNMYKEPRHGLIFLVMNSNHILEVLRAADARGTAGPGGATASIATVPAGTKHGIGKTGANAIKEAEDQLARSVDLYVNHQLNNHFPMLCEFVKKAEQQQRRLAVPEGQPIPNFAPAQAGPLLRDFAERWNHAVESIHRDITVQFADSSCGRDVLQATMTALLKYYTRMLELLKRQGPEGLAMAKDAVNIPSIMYEIKRITKS